MSHSEIYSRLKQENALQLLPLALLFVLQDHYPGAITAITAFAIAIAQRALLKWVRKRYQLHRQLTLDISSKSLAIAAPLYALTAYFAHPVSIFLFIAPAWISFFIYFRKFGWKNFCFRCNILYGRWNERELTGDNWFCHQSRHINLSICYGMAIIFVSSLTMLFFEDRLTDRFVHFIRFTVPVTLYIALLIYEAGREFTAYLINLNFAQIEKFKNLYIRVQILCQDHIYLTEKRIRIQGNYTNKWDTPLFKQTIYNSNNDIHSLVLQYIQEETLITNPQLTEIYTLQTPNLHSYHSHYLLRVKGNEPYLATLRGKWWSLDEISAAFSGNTFTMRFKEEYHRLYTTVQTARVFNIDGTYRDPRHPLPPQFTLENIDHFERPISHPIWQFILHRNEGRWIYRWRKRRLEQTVIQHQKL